MYYIITRRTKRTTSIFRAEINLHRKLCTGSDIELIFGNYRASSIFNIDKRFRYLRMLRDQKMDR